MKKRKLLIVLIVIVALAVPFSVFAATSDATAAKTVRGFFGFDASKLNDQQKADVKTYTTKMADLQKEFINKMVANGTMTKEQGDAAIKKIDDMLKSGQTDGAFFGMGKGMYGGNEKRGGFNSKGIVITNLTDKQKADLADSTKKINDLQKVIVGKIVADGLLTKEQGDNINAKLDAMAKSGNNGGYAFGMMGRGLGFGINGIDTSKLTDQQKTELTDLNKQMSDLQKELINKMVSNGALTKEQGDAAISRIDAMPAKGDISKGMGMRKGRFGGRMMQKGTNPAGNATPATPATPAAPAI
jgi:polyhydroxyalkanoate synthesis regulator phasin